MIINKLHIAITTILMQALFNFIMILTR